MMENDILQRYGQVLYQLDTTTEKLKSRIEEFAHLLKILDDNPRFVDFLDAPQIDEKDKLTLTHQLLQNHFSPTLLTFFEFIIKRKKVKDLHQIFECFRNVVNRHLGLWEAKIITAVPLTDDLKEKIKDKLQQRFQKQMEIQNTIDPKIIGGAILIVDNEMADWSVANRLRKIKENLLTLNV